MEKFQRITRRKGLSKVLQAVNDASAALPGRGRVKINCVVMKGFNENEMRDFVELTKDCDIDVRFIEWMPFQFNGWDQIQLVTYEEMLNIIQRDDQLDFNSNTDPIPLHRLSDGPNEKTKWYQGPSYKGRVGFITSMSEHFCSTCNRLRITADGKIKVCLFGSKEISLRDVMRKAKASLLTI